MTPKLFNDDTVTWANRLSKYLDQVRSLLQFKTDDARATQDGVLLWDAENSYPVVSVDGEFRQIVLSNGTLNAYVDSNVTAAAADTAYGITWTDTDASGITVSSDEITIEEPGKYLITFSAQIRSDSSSVKVFRFFPRINDVNVPGSTIVASIKDNGSTKVMSRAALFTFAKNDTLKAMWAVDDTNGWLEATAATSYAPSAPAATISIIRVNQ